MSVAADSPPPNAVRLSTPDEGFQELGLLSPGEAGALVRSSKRTRLFYLHAIVGLDDSGPGGSARREAYGAACCVRVSRDEILDFLGGVARLDSYQSRLGQAPLRVQATRSTETDSLFFGTTAIRS